MRVRLLQIIDYWVGVPLCFFMSCIEALRRRFVAPAQPQSAPRNILFIELSEMGSAILAYASLLRAQRAYPGAAIYFLIFAKNAESCAILDVVAKERILTIDDRDFVRFSISTLKALWRMAHIGIDTAIDLELFSRCTALITYLSGASRRVGFHRATNEGLYRGSLLTHPLPYNPHLHISLNFLALVAALEAPPAQIPLVKADLRSEIVPLPQRSSSAQEQQAMRQTLRRENPRIDEHAALLVVNPDPGDALPIRGWPMDRFVSLAARLLTQLPEAFIVVIGLTRSQPYAARMQQALGRERCLDLTGKTASLREIVTLLQLAKLLITNDSGPAHIASLTAIPSVVLYGPETPALYGPLSPHARSLFARYSCSPCLSALNHRYTRCNDNRCLQAISVDEVFAAACHALGIPGEPPRSLFIMNQHDRAA